MLIKLFIIFSLSASSFAWVAPERCTQSNRFRRTLNAAAPKNAEVVPNIEDLAAKQYTELMKTYVNYQFQGMPIQGGAIDDTFYISAPYNCTFHTYNPRLLTSVACTNLACKLTHIVSTTETYTSAEGYNWGVKISTKASFFDKTFEVGGEASKGGTYSCSYTKGKTTTDAVECSENTGKSGYLRLYNVQTDMECDFGRIIFVKDPRGGKRIERSQDGYFTTQEVEDIQKSASVNFNPWLAHIMIDTDKISDRLFQKILIAFPHFNPFTDIVLIHGTEAISVLYYKTSYTTKEFKRIIPFTNLSGDSVFHYACVLDKF